MIAQDIMTKYPAVVAGSEPIRHAAQLMADLDIGALPVVASYHDRKLIGMITDRDIVVRHDALGGSRDCCVADHMTQTSLHVVQPNTDITEVLGSMAHDKIRRVPVVDERNTVVDIISQADIARHFAGPNEHAVSGLVHDISTPHLPAPARPQ